MLTAYDFPMARLLDDEGMIKDALTKQETKEVTSEQEPRLKVRQREISFEQKAIKSRKEMKEAYEGKWVEIKVPEGQELFAEKKVKFVVKEGKDPGDTATDKKTDEENKEKKAKKRTIEELKKRFPGAFK